LKIPKGQSEAVNGRRKDTTMARRRKDSTMTRRRKDTTMIRRRKDTTMARRKDTTMARRRKDTTMARRNMTKEQTMFNKTLHRKLCNDPFLFLELWCLMPLSTIVHFIMAVYFIGGGHRSTQRNIKSFSISISNILMTLK
jgi:hypothetical protein